MSLGDDQRVVLCSVVLISNPVAKLILRDHSSAVDLAKGAPCLAFLIAQIGLMDLAGSTTLLYYASEEAKEGEQAFLERRPANFSKFPRLP